MSRSQNARRSVAVTAALVVTTWGTVALPAVADEGDEAGIGTSGQSQEPGGLKDKSDEKRKDGARDKGRGERRGDSSADAAGGSANGEGQHGDPAGNNGTVKIAPLGELDSIPNNTPHVGCSFEIEWYGYDEGADIVSTVSFAMQAPTKDVGLAVDGPGSVFVGGDPASGAGTDSGLDGRETYTLSFTGEPHPQQGYHVKLTVATPRSKGNDTKTKVFWVEPCESGSDTGDDTGAGTPSTETETETDSGTASDESGIDVAGEQATDDTQVLGVQASTAPHGSDVSAAPARGENASVPTAVDAGENGHSAFGDLVRSPWPLLLVGLGALLTVGALVTRGHRGAESATPTSRTP